MGHSLDIIYKMTVTMLIIYIKLFIRRCSICTATGGNVTLPLSWGIVLGSRGRASAQQSKHSMDACRTWTRAVNLCAEHAGGGGGMPSVVL